VLKLAEFGLLALRLVLAVVFLLAATAKFADPRGTRQALRDFGVPRILATPMVLLLPALEFIVGVMLIPVSIAWYGAWGALGLLAVFMLAVGTAMLRGRKPDCHCFGQLHSAPVGAATLIRNVVIGAGAGWLIYRGPSRAGPEVWTWFGGLTETEQKFAFLAALAVGFLFLRTLSLARRPAETESIASQLSFFDDEPEEEQEPGPVQPQRPSAPRPVRRAQPQPDPHVSRANGVGLPIGTPAPEFDLPGLDGARHSLQSLRAQGRDVMLIFSSPFCKPCEALLPDLGKWLREIDEPPNVVLISRGGAPQNSEKLKEFDPSRVLVQRRFEIAESFDCTLTPTAVLVGPDGNIRSLLATGGPAIRQLLTSTKPVSAPS
jgi:uncharacterized membrane protein YphA (DoxX/SURF4 family)/peroxiredoxin